jgi:hypothetical protein
MGKKMVKAGAKNAVRSKALSRSSKKAAAGSGKTIARPGTKKLAALQGSGMGDWREGTLDRMRALIMKAAPETVEERKWKKPSNGMAGVPVWSDPEHGMVCTGETYAKVVKLTFARGASVPDPSGLFNASLEGGTRRAIDIREGETVDAAAFCALVKAAVAVNAMMKK